MKKKPLRTLKVILKKLKNGCMKKVRMPLKNEMLNSLHEKLNTFEQWATKLRKSKVTAEEKKRYREQKLHKSPRNTNPISKIAVKLIIHPKTICIKYHIYP